MGFRNIATLFVFVVITAQMATADICVNQCKYGGTCTPTQQGSSFHCDCTPGRCGRQCNQDFSNCNGNRKDCCENGGSCVDGDTPSCVCTTGWRGAFCELVAHCASNPCQNQATCNEELEGYTCTCAAGFLGTNCEIIDYCASNPCLNDATCNNGLEGYTCKCVAGFTGTNCETNINECESSPCINGGECVDGINMYTCNCLLAYDGINCEIDTVGCYRFPCFNGGTCDITEKRKKFCRCVEGYTGPHCQHKPEEQPEK